MSYRLGVDLGTMWTAAAVGRGGSASVAPLGTKLALAPTVAFVRDDGTALTGDAAERLASSEPDRVGRGFTRLIGERASLVVAGREHTPDELTSQLLKDIVGQVVDQEGERPSAVAVCHPAHWDQARLALLREFVVRATGVSDRVHLITEPVAAAAVPECDKSHAKFVGERVPCVNRLRHNRGQEQGGTRCRVVSWISP